MKTVTVKRWIALSAMDYVTIEVPDDFDVDDPDRMAIYDYPVVAEDRQIIDSTDSGPWEVVED